MDYTTSSEENLQNSTGYRVPHQIFNATEIKNVKRTRRDETRLGSLIYADTLQHLLNYVQRINFPIAAGNFILIVNKPVVDDWSPLSGQILATLWRKYRILYAFLILSCPETEVNIVVNNVRSNIFELNETDLGNRLLRSFRE